ncbi:hypothetical protein BC828DRAFT_47605 [Blastocladiella britannica]|nr:hypothetical protein BC828DRAFT_47605 [Blastocladiella britannica]
MGSSPTTPAPPAQVPISHTGTALGSGWTADNMPGFISASRNVRRTASHSRATSERSVESPIGGGIVGGGNGGGGGTAGSGSSGSVSQGATTPMTFQSNLEPIASTGILPSGAMPPAAASSHVIYLSLNTASPLRVGGAAAMDGSAQSITTFTSAIDVADPNPVNGLLLGASVPPPRIRSHSISSPSAAALGAPLRSTSARSEHISPNPTPAVTSTRRHGAAFSSTIITASSTMTGSMFGVRIAGGSRNVADGSRVMTVSSAPASATASSSAANGSRWGSNVSTTGATAAHSSGNNKHTSPGAARRPQRQPVPTVVIQPAADPSSHGMRRSMSLPSSTFDIIITSTSDDLHDMDEEDVDPVTAAGAAHVVGGVEAIAEEPGLVEVDAAVAAAAAARRQSQA